MEDPFRSVSHSSELSGALCGDDYKNAGCSPVGLTGGSDLADGVSVPAQHRREGPDEGEGPHEQQTQDGVLRLQADVPQGPADHEEPLEGQDGQGPQGHDAWSHSWGQ